MVAAVVDTAGDSTTTTAATRQPSKFRFSPNPKPYTSPNPSSYEGLSDSHSASSGCTPRTFFESSPGLSTPGCNVMARPFIPKSQQLVLDEAPTNSHTILELLALRNPPKDVSLCPSVPPEVIASDNSRLTAACDNISSSFAEGNNEDGPVKPLTLIGFIKSKSVLSERDG